MEVISTMNNISSAATVTTLSASCNFVHVVYKLAAVWVTLSNEGMNTF